MLLVESARQVCLFLQSIRELDTRNIEFFACSASQGKGMGMGSAEEFSEE